MEFPEEDFSEPEQGGSIGAASAHLDKHSKSSKSSRLPKRASTTDKASAVKTTDRNSQGLSNVRSSDCAFASWKFYDHCSRPNANSWLKITLLPCRGARVVAPRPHLCGGGAEKPKKSCSAMHALCGSGDLQEDPTGTGTLARSTFA